MCDFCERYGENGERWYYNPALYAKALYRIAKPEVLQQRPADAVAESSMGSDPELIAARINDPQRFAQMRDEVNPRLMEEHIDQVVTLQEAQAIVDIAYPLAFVACQCRREWRGLPDEENFGCMGLGPGMYKWERWPNSYRGGVAFVTPEEAKEGLARMNQKGYVQKISTLGLYAAELCNCTYPACHGLRTVFDYGVKFVRKGHYVAKVDYDLCDDCGRCYSRCQFYALKRDPTNRKSDINLFKCYGCGLCKEICTRKAITLVERSTLPAVAKEWW